MNSLPVALNLSPVRRLAILLLVLLALGRPARAADLTFAIDTDTYLDSQKPATNFGNAITVKALINNNVTSDGSACRGLFQFPAALGLQDTGKMARVQVCFYVFSDQTSGRHVTLYPLTRPFSEGTGGTDGATWNTFDGTNAWTTPGGDFDTNHPVVGVRDTNGFFRWDITLLMGDAATRSNLLNNGALLQIDEIPVPTNGTPRAPFTSSDGAAADRPYVVWTVAAPLSFAITADTYLDSRTANAANNYGHAITVKTLVNSSDASVCRGLFRLPDELGLYAPGELASAKVFFYVWQDNTAERNVRLYPLTRAFVPGTGNGTAPADGATWNTFDGTNAWTAPGGDFDPNFPVIGIKEAILDEGLHDRFFSWEIAPLLTNATARSNLLAHGALLMIDETPVPPTGMPRAPFTSADDLAYAAAYRPHVEVRVVVRRPAVPQISVATQGVVTLDVAECSPYVTHRIERTPDLTQTNGWTFVSNLVVGGTSTNWQEPLPAGWSNAFYRVVAVP